VGKPLVRFCEGQENNLGMEKILWHRRESRRKTEKTNIFLQPWEAPAYSKGEKGKTEIRRYGETERKDSSE